MPLLKLVKSKENFAKQTEEYYNAIRTNIQFSGAQMKVIAVSSVEAGEGKKASGHYLSRWLSGSQRGKTGTASCTVYLEHYRNAAKGIQS